MNNSVMVLVKDLEAVIGLGERGAEGFDIADKLRAILAKGHARAALHAEREAARRAARDPSPEPDAPPSFAWWTSQIQWPRARPGNHNSDWHERFELFIGGRMDGHYVGSRLIDGPSPHRVAEALGKVYAATRALRVAWLKELEDAKRERRAPSKQLRIDRHAAKKMQLAGEYLMAAQTQAYRVARRMVDGDSS